MNKNTIAIYTAGLLQGIALVAFPAVSTILTSPGPFHFSSTEYGSLFIPQSILSIIIALINPVLCKRFGCQRVFTAGLFANFFAMALLALSALFTNHHQLAFWVLMLATGCLGIGFGLVVPTINRVAEELYPVTSDSAVLTLNALLGVGTALSPVFIILFTALGFWWGLPFFLSIALILLIAYSFSIKLPEDSSILIAEKNDRSLKSLIWIFISFAFLYGIVETLNGNWISIYMSKHLNAPIKVQSLALTAFWGMVTIGRILLAKLSNVVNPQTAFKSAPFLIAIAFVLIASLNAGQEDMAVIAFGLTGLGCSILLPLIISFGGTQLKDIAASVPGMLISSYLLGYGVAAFGVGPLQEFGHVSLRVAYLLGAVISLILGMLAIHIMNKKNTQFKRS
jgi:MFS family permease